MWPNLAKDLMKLDDLIAKPMVLFVKVLEREGLREEVFASLVTAASVFLFNLYHDNKLSEMIPFLKVKSDEEDAGSTRARYDPIRASL